MENAEKKKAENELMALLTDAAKALKNALVRAGDNNTSPQDRQAELIVAQSAVYIIDSLKGW